jgi:catechol 2,3-dioxygenase-like lactoylglutathione lyase family enzyme
MAIESFEIISVPVSDQEGAKTFYRDILGFELIRDEPMGAEPNRPGTVGPLHDVLRSGWQRLDPASASPEFAGGHAHVGHG